MHKNKEDNIKKIIANIKKFGSFTIADVEASESPEFPSRGRLTHLIEEFDEDGCTVFVYEPNMSENPIDYDDVDEDEIESILELSNKLEEVQK